MDKLTSFIQEMTPEDLAFREISRVISSPGAAWRKPRFNMACFFSRFRPLSWAHECQSFVAALDSVISAADPDSAVGDHTGPQFLSTIGYRKSRQAKGALS